MTEAEWLRADHPYKLIYHPSCRNDRKRRLLACACARRALEFLPDSRFSEVVDGCERFADSAIAWKDVLVLRKLLRKARADLKAAGDVEYQHHAADAIEAITAKEFMSFKMSIEAAAAARGSKNRPKWDQGHDRETTAQLALVRDIFVNPFRPVVFDPAWRTDTARLLSRQMYESRDFGAMPILADALQDAGCDSDDVLTHCRVTNGVHVRGCWVVDLVLGKA